MKKIDGKIISKCAQCEELYGCSPNDYYCNRLYVDGKPHDILHTDRIRSNCPFPDAFTDREEMKAMILKLYAGNPRTIYTEAREWLLKEGMIETEQCEVL